MMKPVDLLAERAHQEKLTRMNNDYSIGHAFIRMVTAVAVTLIAGAFVYNTSMYAVDRYAYRYFSPTPTVYVCAPGELGTTTSAPCCAGRR